MAETNPARNFDTEREPAPRGRRSDPALTPDMEETLGNLSGGRETGNPQDAEVESEADDPEEIVASDAPDAQES